MAEFSSLVRAQAIRAYSMRGAELLRCSDVVLYDGLCNPEILAQAPQAEQICVGKHGKSRIWTQEEIIQEIETCKGTRENSIPPEEVTNIFARTAKKSKLYPMKAFHLKLSPASPQPSQQAPMLAFQLPTGNTPRRLHWSLGMKNQEERNLAGLVSIGSFPGTLVIYMGVTTAKHWTDNLITAGLAGKTSVAIIRRCSLPDQQILRCSLEDVPGLLGSHSEIRPPVIVIIGKVTDLQIHEVQQFAERKPLSGQTILVTKPIEQSESLAASPATMEPM